VGTYRKKRPRFGFTAVFLWLGLSRLVLYYRKSYCVRKSVDDELLI